MKTYLSGLCIFLDISRSTWNEYVKREDFSYITNPKPRMA
ncbi:hypothetical protein XBI1_1300001 [Xenorhabdus bovienii str. Intermedium]|uniref:Uncharacterized protein n=1 Tax=Xenorhabdus bovienii str. Intermedium TaxID=1379677 RepID=A0A077QCL5_XENBV|nr:hypothetical protein XBI1_1300001 [Xenorhabdus bovienii str. Intermedium]